MIKKYFARANTASGCVNLAENNFDRIEKICVLKGRSKTAKTMILKKILSGAENRFSSVEAVMSPFVIGTLDGAIIRDIKIAFVDEELYNGDTKDEIDCDAFLSEKACEASEEYLGELLKRREGALRGLYENYKAAKDIHDEWEKVYIKRMDFRRLNAYSDGIIEELIGRSCGDKGTDNYERFFGASTVDGSVNYIDNITENLDSRYFIKGRPGTGKSTFLKRLAKRAKEAGFDTEIYYCSFDKESLDMVVVPELSFCVFDSTAPHEKFPTSQRDHILDFYEEAGLCGVDEACKKELEFISKRYKHKISEGLATLRIANLCESEVEFYYERMIDKNALDVAANKIIKSF